MMISFRNYKRLPTGRLQPIAASDGDGDVVIVTVEGVDEAHVFELPEGKPHLDFLCSAVMAAHAIGEARQQEKIRGALGVTLITDIRQLKRGGR
ncbi:MULTISPECIES: hypothetical protein [unclassified Bradyrhizobium]|uniref:hypothetical protein n=2 Tax=Bradyrhizobium TaxID=374 RepID=UPI002916DEFA|nr:MULTISPECIES: hypothetical protein [unclassified Bradyrhizobium]